MYLFLLHDVVLETLLGEGGGGGGFFFLVGRKETSLGGKKGIFSLGGKMPHDVFEKTKLSSGGWEEGFFLDGKERDFPWWEERDCLPG